MLPFIVITPQSRGLSIGEIGAVFAVHSVVAIALEVPSGALADIVGRRRVMLVGAALTVVSLLLFAFAQSLVTFMASVGLLAAGRALISGSLEAWYVDSLQAARPVGAADARPLARHRRGGDRDGARRARSAAAWSTLAASGGGPDGALLRLWPPAALAGGARARSPTSSRLRCWSRSDLEHMRAAARAPRSGVARP